MNFIQLKPNKSRRKEMKERTENPRIQLLWTFNERNECEWEILKVLIKLA
jgi:hypothetical protein